MPSSMTRMLGYNHPNEERKEQTAPPREPEPTAQETVYEHEQVGLSLTPEPINDAEVKREAETAAPETSESKKKPAKKKTAKKESSAQSEIAIEAPPEPTPVANDPVDGEAVQTLKKKVKREKKQ